MERAVVFDYLRLSQTAETRLLKKVNVRQLFMLLSVSLFSLVFSSTSFPSFLRPFNSYISTSFLFRLLTHTVDKNCIFLICNGILVFLARSSGLIKGSRFWSNGSYKGPRQAEPLSLHMKARASEYTDERFPGDLVRGSDYSPMGNADGYSMAGGRKESKDLTENRESSDHKEEVITTSVGGEERPIEEHKTRGATSPGEEDGFDQTGDDHGDDQVPEEEEEEEEEEEDADMLGSKVLSTEELNKKFDEFIRRMKEEIRIEDQQQLVMV